MTSGHVTAGHTTLLKSELSRTDSYMPEGTWDRLPEAKRSGITTVAETEFAARGYTGASLNVISRQAGISKGSLFQYFSDKGDLWRYIVDRASTRIAKHMFEALRARDPSDPAGTIDHLAAEWIGYFFDHPIDRALAAAATADPDPAASSAVAAASLPYFRSIITEALNDPKSQKLHDGRAVDIDGIIAILMTLLPSLVLTAHRQIGDRMHEPTQVVRRQSIQHAQRLIGIVVGTR